MDFKLLYEYLRYEFGIEHLSLSLVVERIQNPNWEKVGKCHDWRNHIEEWVQKNWESLSLETRVYAIAVAEQQARKEVWE